jgi:hypothetical protein
MRRFFLCGLAALAAIALAAPPTQALRIAVMPNASTKTKLIHADAVVVGKVTGIDKETVDLPQFPGGPKVAHTVANVKIETAVFGAKNVTHVKLAFVKPGEQPQPGGDPLPGRPIRPGIPGRGGQQVFIPAEDQEGVFFLHKHPSAENYFIVQMGHNPVLSSDPNYKGELDTVKAAAAAFADPVKALQAEKDEDRLANALSLAQKYRVAPMNNQTGVTEETAVPVEETKLFLKVLSDLDWTKHADAARLADALGLMPGNYGIPRVSAGEGEEPMAARQKAFKAWAEKYGAKFEVKKVSAKPATEKQPAPPPGGPGPIRRNLDR